MRSTNKLQRRQQANRRKRNHNEETEGRLPKAKKSKRVKFNHQDANDFMEDYHFKTGT